MHKKGSAAWRRWSSMPPTRQSLVPQPMSSSGAVRCSRARPFSSMRSVGRFQGQGTLDWSYLSRDGPGGRPGDGSPVPTDGVSGKNCDKFPDFGPVPRGPTLVPSPALRSFLPRSSETRQRLHNDNPSLSVRSVPSSQPLRRDGAPSRRSFFCGCRAMQYAHYGRSVGLPHRCGALL